MADLPIDPFGDSSSITELKELEAQLAEQYPRLAEISESRNVAIEAETSTIKKPMQTLTNLRKALEQDKMCVFACKDATFDDTDSHGIDYWPGRGENIIYDTQGNNPNYDRITCVADIDENGRRSFYNKTSKLRITGAENEGEEKYAVRPQKGSASELTWKEDSGGRLIAETSKGDEVAQFNDITDVEEPEPVNVDAFREETEDGEWIVREGPDTHGPYPTLTQLREEWHDLYAPFIPEVEFPRTPREEDFKFVIFPDSDNEDYHGPQLYDQGEIEPLLPDEIDWGRIRAESPDGSHPDEPEGEDEQDDREPTGLASPYDELSDRPMDDQEDEIEFTTPNIDFGTKTKPSPTEGGQETGASSVDSFSEQLGEPTEGTQRDESVE